MAIMMIINNEKSIYDKVSDLFPKDWNVDDATEAYVITMDDPENLDSCEQEMHVPFDEEIAKKALKMFQDHNPKRSDLYAYYKVNKT